MKEKQIHKWEKTRKIGKKKFIFYYGVLFWGLLTGFLFPIIGLILFKKPLSLGDFIISLIIFPLGGILFGLMVWHSSEKNFQKYVK